MITVETIEKLVNETLSDAFFLVEISVGRGNIIDVTIDGNDGVTVQKCIDVSRYIEQHLDRDLEDFELNVSSAGLGMPFKVYRQWVKNEGNRVEVIHSGGKAVPGILRNVTPEGFELEIVSAEKMDGSKKKVEVIRRQPYRFDQKPEVKNIISFK